MLTLEDTSGRRNGEKSRETLAAGETGAWEVGVPISRDDIESEIFHLGRYDTLGSQGEQLLLTSEKTFREEISDTEEWNDVVYCNAMYWFVFDLLKATTKLSDLILPMAFAAYALVLRDRVKELGEEPKRYRPTFLSVNDIDTGLKYFENKFPMVHSDTFQAVRDELMESIDDLPHLEDLKIILKLDADQSSRVDEMTETELTNLYKVPEGHNLLLCAFRYWFLRDTAIAASQGEDTDKDFMLMIVAWALAFQRRVLELGGRFERPKDFSFRTLKEIDRATTQLERRMKKESPDAPTNIPDILRHWILDVLRDVKKK